MITIFHNVDVKLKQGNKETLKDPPKSQHGSTETEWKMKHINFYLGFGFSLQNL